MLTNSKKISTDNVIYSLVFIAIVIFGYWLYTKLEYHTIEKDQGYQGEAKFNDYLAAEFYLLSMGQNAKKIKLFTDKQVELNNNDTLFIPSTRIAFDARRSAEIINWVKTGGHLIITGRVETEDNVSQRDHILESIGLYIKRQSLSESSTQNETPVNVVTIGDDFLTVDFDDYLVISRTAQFESEVVWSIEDEDRIHGLQIVLGKGRVTLLSEMRSFKNEYISSYDHAAFLFFLSGTQLNKGEPGIFYYSLFEDQISLLEWLWINAHLFMLSFITFLIFILWMLVPRFGPLINVQLPNRRQFLDHLTASGNYHWRQSDYSRLLMDVRKQLSHSIKIKYPEWTVLNKRDQLVHLADISQIEVPIIENALFNTDIQKVDDFIVKIKVLEKLRKSL